MLTYPVFYVFAFFYEPPGILLIGFTSMVVKAAHANDPGRALILYQYFCCVVPRGFAAFALTPLLLKEDYVLAGKPHKVRDFAEAPANDERVINGPGVNVPCISINRWPYEEYHTSDDNPGIIQEDMLQGSVDVVEKIIRIFATNYIPKRKFRGPVFLSGHGLWVDWQENWALNRAIETIMMEFEGDKSIFEIARKVDLDYWMVRDYVNKFYEKGLIDILPIPGEGSIA